MTIEEAIDIIKCLAWHTRPDEEDVEQAIKVLEQQPCDDCISRQAVLEPYQTLDDNDTICVWLIRKNIEQQSPVTPKEKSECEHDHEVVKAYNNGQAYILDKIRAEIENDWQFKQFPRSPWSCGLRRAIEIIDKYKAESEDKE